MRLDKYLVEHQYFTSREKAQTAISHQTVKVDGKIVDKPSKEVNEGVDIEIIDIFNKYVSMGGLKLEKGIEDFGLDFNGMQVLDVGASTGGFTDCALQHGAEHVTAVDVGTMQMVDSLRNNPKVTSIENTDFRELTPTMVNNQQFDYIVGDVSFISLSYILPYCAQFLKPNGHLVFLIKPQFEAGPSFLSRNGIVTDEKGYKAAINKVTSAALNEHFFLNNLTISTLFELHKNVEFLALFSQTDNRYVIRFPELMDTIKTLKKGLK